jgi:hypothetical protein
VKVVKKTSCMHMLLKSCSLRKKCNTGGMQAPFLKNHERTRSTRFVEKNLLSSLRTLGFLDVKTRDNACFSGEKLSTLWILETLTHNPGYLSQFHYPSCHHSKNLSW